jgi:hypothetical protein
MIVALRGGDFFNSLLNHPPPAASPGLLKLLF